MFSQGLYFYKNSFQSNCFTGTMFSQGLYFYKNSFQSNCFTGTMFSQGLYLQRNCITKISFKKPPFWFHNTIPFYQSTHLAAPAVFDRFFLNFIMVSKTTILPTIPRHNSTKPQHIRHFTTSKPQPLPDGSFMFSLWNRLMSLPFHYFTVPKYHILLFHYSK